MNHHIRPLFFHETRSTNNFIAFALPEKVGEFEGERYVKKWHDALVVTYHPTSTASFSTQVLLSF